MKTVTLVNISCSLAVFIGNIYIVRNYGLELKGQIATVYAIAGLYSSVLVAGFTIIAPKFINKYTLKQISVIGLIPASIFFATHNYIVDQLIIPELIFILFFYLYSVNLILSISFVIRRNYLLIALTSLGLPISVLIASLQLVQLTSSVVFQILSAIYAVSLIIALKTTQQPRKNNICTNELIANFLKGFKFTPYTFLSTAPTHIAIVYLINDIEKIAIYSIIQSVSQISLKFTRNIQINIISKMTNKLRKEDYLFHGAIIFALMISSWIIMQSVYQIPSKDFSVPLIITLLSNIFILNITSTDAKLIFNENITYLVNTKIISLLAFATTYICLPTNNVLLSVSISILISRLTNAIICKKITVAV